MFTKLDAVLFAAFVISGAMALENHGRRDISPDNRTIALAPIVCRPAQPSGLSLPSAIDIALNVPFEPTLVEFAVECQPS